MTSNVADGVFDADNHYYEPLDAFSRHIDRDFADRTVRVAPDGQVVVDEQRYHFLDHAFATRVPAPGTLKEAWHAAARGEPVEGDAEDVVDPAFVDRPARLRFMDEHGISSCFMLPSVGVTIQHLVDHDIALAYAVHRAFNRWLEDDWGYGDDGRIFGVPVVPLIDPDESADELRRVLGAGARLVAVPPGPAGPRGGRCSPADPRFDGFWCQIDEARVPVVLHISESGYNEMYSVDWSEEPRPSSSRFSALQWTLFNGYRPAMDTIAALILHNLFGRYPRVRVVSLENGSLWVPFLLASMDKMTTLGRNGRWVGGPLLDRPSDVFREHVWVAPYPEEDVLSLVRALGDEHVLFGSDFPHPEGLAEPVAFADRLTGLDERAVRNIMRVNAAGLVRS